MVSFSLSDSSSLRPMLPHRHEHALDCVRRHNLKSAFAVAFFSVLCSICFASEAPHEMASICERHNTAMACQVY